MAWHGAHVCDCWLDLVMVCAGRLGVPACNRVLDGFCDLTFAHASAD